MPQTATDPVTAHRTMRALVFDGVLRLGTLPRPVPGEREVLIRVTACGISRADVDMVAGRRSVEISPAVLGHQFVGVVCECGEGADQDWMGKRVVGQTVPGCGWQDVWAPVRQIAGKHK